MRKNIKGFYTLEAAIFLPLVILTVMTIGYFMRVDGAWENCVHGALDECSLSASKAYGKKIFLSCGDIEKRISEDNPGLEYVKVKRNVSPLSITDSQLRAYTIEAGMRLSLPLGFDRDLNFKSKILYRNFSGKHTEISAMGSEGLENSEDERPVWIFPHSGEKYHSEGCTYVKATVEKKLLNSSIKKKYSSCGICESGKLPAGSLVFCFKGENTAYHKGSCRSINRHTIVIDESEAIEKGYTACSKCGGR